MSCIAILLALWVVAPPQDSSRSVERQVQAAAIDSLFVSDTTERVVVTDSTIRGGSHFVDEDYRAALTMFGALPDGLRQNFEKVRGMQRLVDSLPTRVPVVVFDATARARLGVAGKSPREYWRAFYQRYPHSPGWLALSRAGFSRDGNSALVMVEYGCGGRCGGTRYVLLGRRAGRWQVLKVAEPRSV